jgi:hypothetical protein
MRLKAAVMAALLEGLEGVPDVALRVQRLLLQRRGRSIFVAVGYE